MVNHYSRDSADDVSDLLVAIVRDLNSLLSPVEALLSQIPIVGPILKDINTALDAIILGLDKTLVTPTKVSSILKHRSERSEGPWPGI